MVSWLTDDLKATTIISIMALISGLLRFFQEFRSSRAAEKLKAMVRTTATVSRIDPSRAAAPQSANGFGSTLHQRGSSRQEIPIKLLAPGDILRLAAGDMVPADVRLLTSKDLFVSQAALTGEALPVEKSDEPRYSPNSLRRRRRASSRRCNAGDIQWAFSATASMIVHMIRTAKIPFLQSRAAPPLLLLTVAIMTVGICIPFSPLAGYLGMSPLPTAYFFWLAATLLVYSALTQAIKAICIRKFGVRL